MKKLITCSMLIMLFSASGCIIRTIPYEVDRVDQELKGNRGVIQGKDTQASDQERKKTRTMYDIEIELFSKSDFQKTKKAASETKKDDVIYGNKGYMETKNIPEAKKSLTRQYGYGVITESGKAENKNRGIATEPISSTNEKFYVVQKGDTLQKISSKMYGTTKRWKKIFEANKNILKDPDKIKEGQKLAIPQ